MTSILAAVFIAVFVLAISGSQIPARCRERVFLRYSVYGARVVFALFIVAGVVSACQEIRTIYFAP